ncbi:hypothetical protein QEZ54_20490 [Catellatospora sp. KI3]|uniref:hypothetical protein n=1 Tax=Catellatospora sp. KI3 TaxID=3041620 RepID=UPI0024831E1A|nr:hypothetical protein [Catellatospora sp. KI3]MDI1463365.1 hypothetical protein [Catellatospora sp. KI3]
MTEVSAPTLDDYVAEAAVVGIYQQVFAVLARESNAMVDDADSVKVDESILDAFAGAGPGGLSVDQVAVACRGFPDAQVRRRFSVLRSYRAVVKVNDRPNEMFYQATFAPYVMLLFLRRLGDTGGQAELHRLLSLARMSLDDKGATAADARAHLVEVTNVFRLLANPLMHLATSAAIEALREQARPLLGNEELLNKAQEYHDAAAEQWPQLLPACSELRMALAGYRDAVSTATHRLLAHAGKTRALGLLPAERWRTFARDSDASVLASALDGLLFDAPAPHFPVEALLDAVEEGLHAEAGRVQPPRPRTDDDPTPTEHERDTEGPRLAELAELLLAGSNRISVARLLREAGPWPAGRQVLSHMIAIHHRDELAYELTWGDGLRVDVESAATWVTDGWFGRTGTAEEGVR